MLHTNPLLPAKRTSPAKRISPVKSPGKLCLLALGLAGLLLGAPQPSFAQSKIEVAVNNGVITTYQITQRSRFLRLTGFKGDPVEEATRQLIQEELQLQEAQRVGFSLPPNTVTEAYGRLARSNGTTAEIFTRALRERGINPDTLRQLIKARILWQQVVTARARAEGNRAREAQDVTSILFNRGGDGKNRKVTEYTLEQFIFILKSDVSENEARQRLREVEAFRRSNSTCKSATESAQRLASSGVVTKPLGRFTSDTLPAQIKPDIEEANGALFTKPKRSQPGIEFLAICNTREIVDNSSSGSINIDVGRLGSQELEEKSKQWIAELRSRATIRTR